MDREESPAAYTVDCRVYRRVYRRVYTVDCNVYCGVETNNVTKCNKVTN